jgi:hypothetical protein
MRQFVDEYRRREIIEAGVSHGFCCGEAVIVPGGASGTLPQFMVMSIWGDQSAYDGWLAAPERVSVHPLGRGPFSAQLKRTRSTL